MSQTETVGYRFLVGARRRALIEGLRRGRWLQEDGDNVVKLLETLTHAKTTRGGGAEAATATGRGRSAQSV